MRAEVLLRPFSEILRQGGFTAHTSAVPKSDGPEAQRLARNVVKWFVTHARDLPWRRTKDPYAIWISEVMLQQTQVKTVIPYWERWMLEFPTIESLAAAREERILKAWEGLGYYRRARALQSAAQLLAKTGGQFPQSPAEIRALPGIGPYTAGAISSIAFGLPEPILDGNVRRVLARVYTIDGDPEKPETQRTFWTIARSLVESVHSQNRCSELNQGLMELGATICLPRNPKCSECPVRRQCRAFQNGTVEQYPRRVDKPEMKQRHVLAFLLRRKTKVLVRRRAAHEVNGGLWEFPNIDIPAEASTRSPDLSAWIPNSRIPLTQVAVVKHTIMRHRITIRAFAGHVNGEAAALSRAFDGQWMRVSDLEKLPFSSAHSRLRKWLQGEDGPKIQSRPLEPA